MNPKIALILLILSGAVVFPFMPASADPATPLETPLIEEGSAVIPPQLKPPTEDVSQLEETEDPGVEKPYNIPMVLNDSVETHLEYFNTRGRDKFQLYLDRSARFMPMMKDILREKNLPEDLVYVALIESGFNPYAVSWCKAVGAWQFMPGTAKLYGLKIDWWIDERKDPIKSTKAAAELLKDLHDHFGSWPLALASYNAGEGKVHRALLKTRSDDFWDLKASRFIKPETKNYIPKYMAATIIAKNPEGYGFTPGSHQPFKYDEVTLEESADLRLIARCSECTYEEIKELNPELKRWVTPPSFDRYVLRIPSGKKDVFLANFAAVPPEQKIKWERHEVKKGETLASLAKKYNTTSGAIRDANGLHKNRLPPGKHILIPVDMNETADAGYMNPGQVSRPQEILYRVRRGETLVKIAKKHDISVADIKEWNKGIGNSVRTGQKIKLIVDVNQI
jgi:membrane-bound lytic murein transglycosylase D